MEGERLIETAPLAPAEAARATRPNIAQTALQAVARRVESHRTLVKFAVVGGSGYVMYSGLLFLLYDFSLLPFLPEKGMKVDLLLFTYDDYLRLITTLIGGQLSIMAVFAGHTLWTFSDWAAVRKPLWLRAIQFELKALVPTLGILTIVVNGLAIGFGIQHVIAVPLGFLLSFSWNWVWDSKIIWSKRARRSTTD